MGCEGHPLENGHKFFFGNRLPSLSFLMDLGTERCLTQVGSFDGPSGPKPKPTVTMCSPCTEEDT